MRPAIKRGECSKSAVAEHAWECGEGVMWNKTAILDRAGRQIGLRVKEALHIQLETQKKFNRDVGLDIPKLLGLYIESPRLLTVTLPTNIALFL